jgi:putative transposase
MSSRPRAEATASALPPATTPIGVDVGEDPLYAAATADTAPSDARTVSGAGLGSTVDALVETIRVLRSGASVGDTTEAAVVASYWQELRSMVDGAIPAVLEYAHAHTAPVLVLEDLGHDPPTLWALRDAERAAWSPWIVTLVQAGLVDAASAAGIPIRWTPPDGTTRECHACGERGELPAFGAVFRCTTPSCPVDVVDRDGGAAVSIAKRGTALGGE